MSPGQLKAVARELRADMIDVVSRTGGHLGAGLGVIELTIALHYLFDTPDDILVWDVGPSMLPAQDRGLGNNGTKTHAKGHRNGGRG